ncbi:MAG: phage holin family protein [Patescibacteria group bacterium]|nr:phage holin family protein [bacterium]MDZ4240615.1 phage holin family protein [Patescibacteria group bacterium]
MINIILTWLFTALTLLLSAQLLPSIVIDGFRTALMVSFIWGLFNVLIKPIIVILTLPLNILTLGLFTFVINGFLFWLISTFVSGFSVGSFFDAVLATLLISAVSFLIQKIIKRDDD